MDQIESGGFAEHILEAMRSNWKRMNGYAQLSNGKSRFLSLAWIALGALTLPIAWYFDRKAKIFQNAGIPVMEMDFISMSLSPEFSTELLPVLDTSVGYPKANWKGWEKRIYELSKASQFKRLHQETEIWIAQINEVPRFHVLLRHLLESVARSAYLAPQYEALALRHQIKKSPVGLSRALLYFLAKGLRTATWLDAWAEPLQRRGIQILIRDIPPVEMSPKL